MPEFTDTNRENERQRRLLETPVGIRGSGFARYGAAMYFYQQGQMSAQMLEVYRTLAIRDNEDPLEVARLQDVS
ncbi:MAG: hypothetical protein WBO55_07630 [Rhizobiaceae bacterium]